MKGPKIEFMKFLAMLGARSSAVCASFLGALYEKQRNNANTLDKGSKALRRADGTLVRRRRRLPNLFTMAQFKPVKKTLEQLNDSIPKQAILEVFSTISECGSYCVSVEYSIDVEMIAPQLLIDDLLPGGLLLSNLIDKAYILQVSDPRGERLQETFGSDIGYSGYAMLHSVLGCQDIIDMADVRRLKEMRAFVSTLEGMTSSSYMQEELDCILTYMKGVVGCWHRTLPEMVGLWLGAPEIREFAGTDDIFIWVYVPGGPMEYVSDAKLSLDCVRNLDLMDHVLLHKKMFRRLCHPSQSDMDPLLHDLERQVSAFLRSHLASFPPVISLDPSVVL